MKKLFSILALVCALAPFALATDVTISAQQITALPFNPSDVGSDQTIAVAVTSGSPTVTSASLFPTNIVGKSGFQVSIGGTQYVVASVASRSSLTLATNYGGSSGSASLTLYKFVLLRVYANRAFQPAGSSEVVQPGGPGTGQFYKEVAVSIINSGAGNVAYIPQFTLPATTDALITNQARYSFVFFRAGGSQLGFYDCGVGKTELQLPPNSPATFAFICNYNSAGGIAPASQEAYPKTYINEIHPLCDAGQMVYYAATGQKQSCLTVGTNLSISSGVLNATGGGSGLTSLNGLTNSTQTFAVGTSGTDFGIFSSGLVHTFNLPTASATNRGALSSADWTTFNNKPSGSGTNAYMAYWTATGTPGTLAASGLLYDSANNIYQFAGNVDIFKAGLSELTLETDQIIFKGGVSRANNAVMQTMKATATQTGNFQTFTTSGGSTVFAVEVDGDIRPRGLSYSWPSTQAAGVLLNNGSGTLSWTPFNSSYFSTSGSITPKALAGAINPKTDYNCVGDDVADDTTCLTNAITAAVAAGGQTIKLDAGTYRTTAKLTVPGGVRIVGDGRDKTLIHGTANDVILDLVQGTGTHAFNGPTLEHLGVRGSSSGANQIGVRTDDALYVAHVMLNNVTIRNTGSHGLYVGKTFSSTFRKINAGNSLTGYPFLLVMPNMPSNSFEELYAEDVNATSPAGFRVRQGEFFCTRCNGINNSSAGSAWMIIGDKIGVDGATSNVTATAHLIDANIESWREYGIRNYFNSRVVFSGLTKFAGEGTASGVAKPIWSEVDSSLFPPFFSKGRIDDGAVFANDYSEVITGTVATTSGSPTVAGTSTLFTTELIVGQLIVIGANTYKISAIGSDTSLTLTANAAATVSGVTAQEVYYAEGFPIHANDVPPIVIDGQGPKIAGGSFQTQYYNTTNARGEALYRSDALTPVVSVTASASFTNPGNRYYEVNCASNCTLTLPWPGWYSPGGESVTVKNLSATGIVVTIGANSGGTVNTPNGYSLTEQYQAVSLIPDVTSLDWRVVGKNLVGVASRVPFYADTAKTTTDADLTFDGFNLVSGRFQFSGGTAGAPAVAPSSDTDTGFYRTAANTLGFAANGADVLSMSTTGLTLGVPGSVAGAAIFSNTTNSNTTTLKSGAPSSSIDITLPATLPASAGCLQISSTGVITQTGSACGGSGSTPGGSNTQVQFNNAGAFGGISGFTSDGTNVTAGSGNLRATRPRFITSIDDTNGNELFSITATGSAVNQFSVANAATGTNPQLSAAGDDANVGLDFLVKGTGVYRFLATTSDSAALRLLEDSDNGTNYVAIKPVAALAADRTASIPDLAANDTFVFEAQTQTLTNKTINSANNAITLPISDLSASNANATFSQTSFNTTFNHTTGLLAASWSGNTSTNNAFALSHSNATATGTLLDLSTSASVSVKPFTVSPRASQAFQIDHLGNTIIGNAAVGTGATNGFLYITSSAGTPTGTPTSYTGRTPISYDSTNNKLYINEAGTWVDVTGSGGGSPGGSDTQVQRNNAGAFGGISGFTSDGTNVTAGSGNLRATSPRFTTDISDTNGNEVFKITATASAVNELTIANAATGANPIVTASGGDANVGIDWLLKGTGTFNLTGNATQAAEIRLYEDTDNGTNYTAFKVGVQAGNVTYTLPTADGSSGQVLSTNGSGVLSWATGGGGGGYATIQEEGTNLTARTTLNFVGSSFTAADDTTRTNVTSDSDLDALASNSTNGLWARTGAGTGSARTLTAGTSAGLTITNGDGVSGNPTVDFATTNTAGLGFSLPGNGGLPFVTDSSNALAGSANEVRVALFYAPVRITVDRVGLNGVTDSASQNAGVGIYSADGNTKICDSGAISTTAWAGAANYALSASCTFGPGYFYFAWTASSTTPTVRSGAAITNFFAPLNNGTGTVLGTAANTSSGGVLPSTLGSLTDSNSLAIPIVRFYKN